MIRQHLRNRLLRLLLNAPELEHTIRTIARHDRLNEHVVFDGPGTLTVHPTAVINNALFNLASGDITVADAAFFGHNVSALTGTHDIERLGVDRQLAIPAAGRDIVIETGAWISSNATVLGPCRIGEHAVVAAGAVVTADVEPFAIVAGVPARVVGRVASSTRA